jgi:hypothetical protein
LTSSSQDKFQGPINPRSPPNSFRSGYGDTAQSYSAGIASVSTTWLQGSSALPILWIHFDKDIWDQFNDWHSSRFWSVIMAVATQGQRSISGFAPPRFPRSTPFLNSFLCLSRQEEHFFSILLKAQRLASFQVFQTT